MAGQCSGTATQAVAPCGLLRLRWGPPNETTNTAPSEYTTSLQPIRARFQVTRERYATQEGPFACHTLATSLHGEHNTKDGNIDARLPLKQTCSTRDANKKELPSRHLHPPDCIILMLQHLTVRVFPNICMFAGPWDPLPSHGSLCLLRSVVPSETTHEKGFTYLRGVFVKPRVSGNVVSM